MILTCRRCNKQKPDSSFYPAKQYKKTGRDTVCKVCYAIDRSGRRAKRQQINPIDFWIKETLARLKLRARQLQVPYDLTYDDIATLICPTCPILGIPLNYQVLSNASASIDR